MSRTFQILLLIISASLMMAAQAYHITPVVTSTSVIAGQDMHDCLAPDRVAISDVGEIAFALYCRVSVPGPTGMVLTTHRIVATDNELIDGKTLRISTDNPVAINSHGQVAYVVIYYIGNDLKNDVDDETKWHTAICVDKHMVVQVPDNVTVHSIVLGEDGTVSFNQQPHQTASASTSSQSLQAIPNALHKIPVKLPPFKMPKNFPIGIPPIGNPTAHQSVPATQAVAAAHAANSSLSTFASNSRGQIVINTRVTMFEFVILVATPTN